MPAEMQDPACKAEAAGQHFGVVERLQEALAELPAAIYTFEPGPVLAVVVQGLHL
jgi:hypothetical protein